jgi:heme exporter protein A
LTAAVELEGVARRFGARWALRGVSLRVEQGEVLALLGHNGSGKTTLLRVIATALRASRGGGRVHGFDLREDEAEIRGLVGILGHSAGIYDDLTAAENLLFAERMRGRRPERAGILEALEQVGLGREVDERTRGFSAGMRRRLALGRLLLQRPRLVLLDEPYASFDAEGIDRLNAFIRSIQAEGGTVLLATHDPARASVVARRMVRLAAGQVVETGSLQASGGA